MRVCAPRAGAHPVDGDFDLVIAHERLCRRQIVKELHRVTRPGAYLALSVLGELARRFGEPGLSRET